MAVITTYWVPLPLFFLLLIFLPLHQLFCHMLHKFSSFVSHFRVSHQAIFAPKALSTNAACIGRGAVNEHVSLEYFMAGECFITVDADRGILMYAPVVAAHRFFRTITLCAILTGEWKEFHFFIIICFNLLIIYHVRIERGVIGLHVFIEELLPAKVIATKVTFHISMLVLSHGKVC